MIYSAGPRTYHSLCQTGSIGVISRWRGVRRSACGVMATLRKIHDALNIRSGTSLRVDTPYGLNKLGFWPGGLWNPPLRRSSGCSNPPLDCDFYALNCSFVLFFIFFCKVKTAFTRDAAEQQPHQSVCGCLWRSTSILWYRLPSVLLYAGTIWTVARSQREVSCAERCLNGGFRFSPQSVDVER